jgi:hypothetical protein
MLCINGLLEQHLIYFVFRISWLHAAFNWTGICLIMVAHTKANGVWYNHVPAPWK